MPTRYQLVLSEEQVKELTWTRDHHAVAYLRSKAKPLRRSPSRAYSNLLIAIRSRTGSSTINRTVSPA